MKTQSRRSILVSVFAAVAAILVASSHAVQAQGGNNPLITVDENGNGTLLFPGSPAIVTAGALAADPGPGGRSSALTYSLLGPPSLIAGDLIIMEAGMIVGDIIRFNPAGTGSAGYPASLVFYSLAGEGALADGPFPTAMYTNVVTRTEGSAEDLFYTPDTNQPGYVNGFSVTYHIISGGPVAAPERGTTLLFFAVACSALLLVRGQLRSGASRVR